MPDIKDQKLDYFFNTAKERYIIPPFQRTITWPFDQWEALLDDIFNLLLPENQDKTHLIQMFQLHQSGSKEFMVGDGQQRLVHTSLILAALAYSLKEISEIPDLEPQAKYNLTATYRKILADNNNSNSCILSYYDKDAVDTSYRVAKVNVAPSNRATYDAIMAWKYYEVLSKKSEYQKCIVQNAFEYYKVRILNYLVFEDTETSQQQSSMKIKNLTPNDLPSERDEISNRADNFLHTMEKRLIFAVAIFDSLGGLQASYENTNSKSVALTESELIKNNIFKNFNPVITQERLVKDYWGHFDSNYWISKYLDAKGHVKKLTRVKGKPEIDRLDDLFYCHLIAEQGKLGIDRTGHHSTFKAFKAHYDKKALDVYNRELKSAKINNQEIDDMETFKFNTYSNFYENVLKKINQQGNLYKQLEGPYPEKPRYNEPQTIKDKYQWDKRTKDFYSRVIDACNVRVPGFSLLISLMNKELNYKDYDSFLSVVESFVIRKKLSKSPLSDRNLQPFFDALSSDKIDIPALKTKLSKIYTQGGRWEGSEEILKHQMKKNWTGDDNKLATLLMIDYENYVNRMPGNMENHRYQDPDLTLEHFMPRNPPKENGWPIQSKDPQARDRLTYNFGNFFPIDRELNGKLTNKSYIDKKKILSEEVNPSRRLGWASLECILESRKWDAPEIERNLEKRLSAILAQYDGPVHSATSFAASQYIVQGIIQPNESIFYLDDNNFEHEVKVQSDGALFYLGISYKTFKDLMLIINPKHARKNHAEIWCIKIGTQLISIKKYSENNLK